MKKLLERLPKGKSEKETAAKAPKGEMRQVRSYFQSQEERRYIIRLTATLLTITVVSAALLGFVYDLTKPIIDERTQEKTEAAMRSVLEADDYLAVPDFTAANGVTAISKAVEDETVVGYVCEVQSSGFGGAMSLVVGVDLEGAVTGVSVVKHGETKNIGTKVMENEAVLADFEGLSFPVTAGGGDAAFDAVSGATYSSNGVLTAVNAALSAVADMQ